jgi:hypothetical protein
MSAMQSLAPLQKLNTETRAVHAAAFCSLNKVSFPCRKMSDVTTRSTSWLARWRAPGDNRERHGASDQPDFG